MDYEPFVHDPVTELEESQLRGFIKDTQYSKEMKELAVILKKAAAYHTTSKIEERLVDWFENTWGVKYEYDMEMHCIKGLKIVDDQKYLLFRLKFL
jgi:hypothetical protein